MQDRVYIMRFGEEIDQCEALLHPVFKERSKSIENQIKRRAGMAAALLFQYAAKQQLIAGMVTVSSLEVMEALKNQDINLPEIQYGIHGKPYVKDNTFRGQPFYFNLSHSEDMAACVISTTEVGIDIQRCKDIDYLSMACKFYAPEEVNVIKNSPLEEGKLLFYRLWTYKEAYGKMTGQGVAGYLGKNMLGLMNEEPLSPNYPHDVIVSEYSYLADYCITVCNKADKE